MNLRVFLVSVTTASLTMLGAPVIICALDATRQHSSAVEQAFESFPPFWFMTSMLFALLAFVFCAVSFYRRDFLIGLYGLVGSVSVFACTCLIKDSLPVY